MVALIELPVALAGAAPALARLQRDGRAALAQEPSPHWQHAPVALYCEHCPAAEVSIMSSRAYTFWQGCKRLRIEPGHASSGRLQVEVIQHLSARKSHAE